MVSGLPDSTIYALLYNTLHVFCDSYFKDYVRGSQVAGLGAGSVPLCERLVSQWSQQRFPDFVK